MISQCCVCLRVREGAQWIRVPKETIERNDVSHGYCPECAAEAFAELKRFAAGQPKLVRGTAR